MLAGASLDLYAEQAMSKLEKRMVPFGFVITAVQGSKTTLADCMRYLLYLARSIMSVGPTLPHGESLP